MNNCCCQPKMSCCCCQPETNYVAVQPYSGVSNVFGGSKNGCTFSSLIILILILLVFSNSGKKGCCGEDVGSGDGFLGGKGIIFIIALFYLSCVNPCGNSGC